MNEIYRQFKNIRQLFIKYNFRPKPKRWRKSNDLGFSPVEVSREVGGSSLERFFRGDLNGSYYSIELDLSLSIWPPRSTVQRIVVPPRTFAKIFNNIFVFVFYLINFFQVADARVLGFTVGQKIMARYYGSDPATGAVRLSRKVLTVGAASAVKNFKTFETSR